jgi:hypothetical protein
VEPSGTNVIVQSQNWLASGWRSDATANVTTVSATTGTLDPLGTNTANAISPTSGSTSHLKVGNDNSASFTSGTIYTESGFFKQGTGGAGRYVQMTYPAARFSQNGFANFDLQAGAVVASGGTADTNRAASIENYGNGWYRCRLTATCTSTGTENGFTAILITASGDTRAPSFAGTTTDVLYGWGAQTETGSVATSYIPTTTASATRNADVVALSGAVSGCIGQTEGTIYAEVDMQRLILGSVFVLDVGGTGEYIAITKLATGAFRVSIKKTSTSAVNIITTTTNAVGVYKLALGYKSGDYALYINGMSRGTSTNSTDYPTGSLIQAVVSNTNYGAFNDWLRTPVTLYTTRLTNVELQALTT